MRTRSLTYEDVKREALAFPEVAESTSYGTPALKVRGKLMLRLKEDLETIVLRSTWEERERLMMLAPDIFYLTDHYRTSPWVLARLPAANLVVLRAPLWKAWQLSAPVKLLREHTQDQGNDPDA